MTKKKKFLKSPARIFDCDATKNGLVQDLCFAGVETLEELWETVFLVYLSILFLC